MENYSFGIITAKNGLLHLARPNAAVVVVSLLRRLLFLPLDILRTHEHGKLRFGGSCVLSIVGYFEDIVIYDCRLD